MEALLTKAILHAFTCILPHPRQREANRKHDRSAIIMTQNHIGGPSAAL